MIAIETIPLLELAELAFQLEYGSCVVYDNTWFKRSDVMDEVDRRVRVGLVVSPGGLFR